MLTGCMQIKEDNGKEVISYHRTASSVVRLVNATFKGKLSVSVCILIALGKNMIFINGI